MYETLPDTEVPFIFIMLGVNLRVLWNPEIEIIYIPLKNILLSPSSTAGTSSHHKIPTITLNIPLRMALQTAPLWLLVGVDALYASECRGLVDKTGPMGQPSRGHLWRRGHQGSWAHEGLGRWTPYEEYSCSIRGRVWGLEDLQCVRILQWETSCIG